MLRANAVSRLITRAWTLQLPEHLQHLLWREGVIFLFLALHHTAETAHILRETCWLFGHQTVSEEERGCIPAALPGSLPHIDVVAERA